MSENPREPLADLAQRFLAEGEATARQLLAESLDIAAIRRAVHGWAGVGGMLGYPQVTALARLIERMVVEPYSGSDEETHQALVSMHNMFVELLSHSRSTTKEVLS